MAATGMNEENIGEKDPDTEISLSPTEKGAKNSSSMQTGPKSKSSFLPQVRTGHQIPRIPSPSQDTKEARAQKNAERMSAKFRYPPSLLRLATVTMTPKSNAYPAHNYVEGPHQYKKVITLDEAINARPPLQRDMEGPTPCSYTPLIKPLSERNAPAFSFGRKTWPEKDAGGGRTSWSKTWFNSPHIWCDKVDFHAEKRWPSPGHYSHRPMLGPNQCAAAEAPSFSIGTRKAFVLTKPGVEKEPSPNEYNPNQADRLIFKSAPVFSHQSRRRTTLWNSKENTPGPGDYETNLRACRPHKPIFTIGKKRPKSHDLGPFAPM